MAKKKAQKKRASRRPKARRAGDAGVSVALTTGQKIKLVDKRWSNKFFKIVVEKTLKEIRSADEFKRDGPMWLLYKSTQELHFVGGQLHVLSSAFKLSELLNDFYAYWGSVGDHIRRAQ
jgi:hypothetical protein